MTKKRRFVLVVDAEVHAEAKVTELEWREFRNELTAAARLATTVIIRRDFMKGRINPTSVREIVYENEATP